MIDQKALDYIKDSLTQGKSKEDIYKYLLNQEWKVDAIEEHFNSLVISEDKGEKETAKEDSQRRTIQIISIIGAFLIGAGIFSFIASNWQDMEKSVKIGIIIISMLSSYTIGWLMEEKYGLHKTGSALVLLGSVIYGAGIFLVAQMFNIRANWPDGFILWMLGSIAMAFATESSLLFYFSVLLGLISLSGHPFEIFDSFGHDSFLLTSSFLLLIATAVTFITGWIFKKRIPPEFKDYY